MLENYEKLPNGIIKQIKVDKIEYNPNYVNTRYNTYGNLVDNMSNLRLGYLLGVLKYIPNSILDVGYGNGSFLKTCTNIIKNCYGNDISGYQLPDKCTFVKDIYKQKFLEALCDDLNTPTALAVVWELVADKEIAGADKKYVWAKARIEGNKVIVWNDAIANPVSVRYAWADNPEGANLYNKEGLPASPFETGDK